MKILPLIAAFSVIASAPAIASDFDKTKMPEAKATMAVKSEAQTMQKDAMMEKEMQAEIAPTIKAVMFYADNCGSCKILDPKLQEAMTIINDEKLELVKFDFSNKDKIAMTRDLAKNAEVDNILQEYGAKTGFVVLVNQKGEVVEKLTKKDDTAEIAGKLAMSIAKNS